MRLGIGCAVALTALMLAVTAGATLPIGPQFRVSQMGPDGDTDFGGENAAVAFNSQANQYLVVWEGTDTTLGELEIWGRLIDASGTPLGGNFRLSDMGPDGDEAYDADDPAVAYNPLANEYLVVWRGEDNIAPLVQDEHEIFGQRVSASGVQLGVNDFRLSDMGPNGDTNFSPGLPDVAFDLQTNEYLAVWVSDDDTGALVSGELEIFGQRLSATGAQMGTNDFRISDMGTDGIGTFDANMPAVAWASQANEYLVVWRGNDGTPPLAASEVETFGQRLSGAGGEVGANDFRISDMGPDGDVTYFTALPDVDYNAQANDYLVVWHGDDDTAPLVNNEFEIFGQRLSVSGTEVGANDFRISDMGVDGSVSFTAFAPAVSYNVRANEYLVAWEGEDGPPLGANEVEVFGQRLSDSGAEVGTNDFRVSEMGPDGSSSYIAENPATAYNVQANEYLIAWSGDDDEAAINGEFEVWARRTGSVLPQPPAPPPPPTDPCTITGTNGNDVLNGTPGPDTICALGGNDRVNGLGGNDRILLGAGNDRAFGGRGRDEILGGAGADRISGDPGRDRLFGQAGSDTFFARDREGDLVDGGPRFDRARVDRRRDTRRSIERLF